MNFHLLLIVVLVSVATAKLPIVDFDSPVKIDGQYIVIYHDNTTSNDMTRHIKQMAINEDNEVTHVYNINDEFKGFSAKLDDASVQQLQDDPLVKELYADITVSIDANSCGSSQANAPSWGLGRTSCYGSNLRTAYYYDQNTAGSGVNVYVIDTGILTTHPEFGGRATHGVNYAGGPNTDQNGHGTHCAGTVGGSSCGIAKYANIFAVKVLGANGSGSLANVIAGVNYVGNANTNNPCVGSMSLGSAYNAAVNNAVAAAVSSGVTMVVAAGNSNANACNYSPASTPSAICVGATTNGDVRSSFSNYGNCVHMWAPGTNIYSCYLGNTYSTLSGTSMACPHVAGQAAVILSQNPNLSPAQVKSSMSNSGQWDLLGGLMAGSPNVLLYNGCDDA
jgi:subtilisin family serine protease